jgi:hypothetical protein
VAPESAVFWAAMVAGDSWLARTKYVCPVLDHAIILFIAKSSANFLIAS